MSKKEIILIGAALVLGGVYVRYFTSVFDKPTIPILAQVRPVAPGNGRHHSRHQNEQLEPVAVDPVSFAFDTKYELTSIRVVVDSEYKTNKYAHCLWHLTSDSNSVPLKGIVYGMKIKGMQSEVPKARPEPLQPNVTYRLLLEAGNLKGEKTFKTHESVQPKG